MAPSQAVKPAYAPGDWHDSLRDLLILTCGYEEAEAQLAVDKYRAEISQNPPPFAAGGPVYSRLIDAFAGTSLGGHFVIQLLARCARETWASTSQRPVPDDHPCGHCGHPKRAHITGPVWCRHCPAQTSGLDQPGWHQYTPAEEQP